MLNETMPALRLQLLGHFRLLVGDEPNDGVNAPRLQALLAYLVLHRDAPHLRQHLAFQLWPDSSESQARTNLRKLFFQLQRALPNADQFLHADAQTIQWRAAAPFTLDVAELQAQLAYLEQEPFDLPALRRVGELYQGQLLPSCYDDWIALHRQQLHQAVMDSLWRLIMLLENQRAYAAGIRYAQRLLSLDPLEEKTYQRLMHLYAQEGDYTAALRVYQECAAILQRELAVEPDGETQALYEQLKRSSGAPRTLAGQNSAQSDLLPLVGRQREWQVLRDAWRRAVRGETHFVCIWGEAGIGKTRLAEELLDWAGRQGILTARTRSYQAHGALAYAPIITLLRTPQLYGRLLQLNDVWLSEIARLLPELLAERPDLPTPPPMTERWQRQRFLEALARAMLVDEQPLLLLFDDLHWCDEETLEWLHFLLHFKSQARLLVAGTSRSEEVTADHPLATLRLNLQREAVMSELELAPLTGDEVTALAQAIAASALTDEQAGQLYADTEGNPLFVVETVRAGLGVEDGRPLVDTPAPPVRQRFLPPKVHAVIRARLTRISPQAQRVASLAAVIGRSFSFAVLAAASHMEEETIIQVLDELWARRLIRQQGEDGYDFSHDRIRDVAYTELSSARRRQLHRHVAEALETVYAGSLDEISGVLADQWEQAGQQEQAVTYLQRAGERAATHYLHAEAIRYFSRALELTPSEQVGKCCQLLLARERIHAISGDRTAQEEDLALLQEVVATWFDDPPQAVVIRAEIAVRLSRHARLLAQPERAIHFARQAVELAQLGNAAQQRADGLLEWGLTLWGKSDLSGAHTQFARALETAEAANLPSRLAESLERLAQVEMFTGGSATDIMNYMQQALENYEKAGDLIGRCSILNKLGYLPVAQGVGEYSQARWHYEQALAFCRRIGNRASEAMVSRNLGILAVCEGDYTEAERHLSVARQLYLQQASASDVAVVLNCLGFTHLNKGQLALAQSIQEDALARLRQHKFRQWEVKALTSLGWIHFSLGNLTLALDYASEARATALTINEQRQAAYAATVMGHVLTQLERYSEASEAFQEAVGWHEQMQQANRRLEPLAGLAALALAQGDLPQAQSIVEEILGHLATHMLDRTEESLLVFLTCYHVLGGSGDQRAQAMLHMAYQQLQTRAATIHDPEVRRQFWEAMPAHLAVRQAIGELPPPEH
jgi:predicted ATPase/DNA-binding SARP family transcriptional activator